MPIDTYIVRCSRRPDDAVLTKFTDALFEALPVLKHLSSHEAVTEVQNYECIHIIDNIGEYYNMEKYENAWKMLSILPYDAFWRSCIASRNVHGFYSACVVPALHDRSPKAFSLYFLCFTIMKVSNFPLLIFSHKHIITKTHVRIKIQQWMQGNVLRLEEKHKQFCT